jgi:hypothetical protein
VKSRAAEQCVEVDETQLHREERKRHLIRVSQLNAVFDGHDMEFDLKASVITIGPTEPALFVSLILAGLVAWPAGSALGTLTARVLDPWRRALYLGPVWLIGGGGLLAVANILLVLVFRTMHPEYREAVVCVAVVWPTFMLAPLLAFAAAVQRVRHNRRGARDVAAP